MDDTFIRIIASSQILSDHLKELLEYTGSKKISKKRNYLSVGEMYNILRKCEALAEDLKDITVSDKVYCYLFYQIMDPYCEFEFDLYKKLFQDTLFSDAFLTDVLASGNNQSGYISLMQTIGPAVAELKQYVASRQSYAALKKYREILKLCDLEGIRPGLSDEELQVEIDKRFHYTSWLSNIVRYKKAVANPVYPEDKDFYKNTHIYPTTYATEIYALRKYLYEIMQDYYKQTNCLLRPVIDGINIYYLGHIIIVAYDYDDIPDMILKKDRLILDWQTRDFWGKVFDPQMRFVGTKETHYLLNGEEPESYLVDARGFKKRPYNTLGQKVIYAPGAYIEEALYKGLTENGKMPLDIMSSLTLQDQGFDLDSVTDKLLTGDNIFFFKDPTLVDDLEVKNLDKYTHLGLIKTKTDPVARRRSIAAIRAATKKKPKQAPPEHPQNNYQSYVYRKSRDRRRYWWDD